MTPLALRVAARYSRDAMASKMLARTLPELTAFVENDLRAGMAWIKQFAGVTERLLKQEHEKLIAEFKGVPKADYILKSAEKLLKETSAAAKAFEKKPSEETAYAIDHPARDIHNDVWDPEMFADGQTKADYARQPLDPMMDVIFKQAKTAATFLQRFQEKWDFGSLNITLESLTPRDLDDGKVALTFLKECHAKGFEAGMKALHEGLEKLQKEVASHPASATGKISVGSALSSLYTEAEKAKDAWASTFSQSLMKQKSLSPKQKAILEEKLAAYNIPMPDYNRRY